MYQNRVFKILNITVTDLKANISSVFEIVTYFGVTPYVWQY